jgi:hypothetical protein
MWCWRSVEKISSTNHVRNEEVLLHRVKEKRNVLHTIIIIKKGWLTGMVTSCVGTVSLNTLLKGR